MRFVKSLSVPLALLLSVAPLAAQISEEDLAAELDSLAAQENDGNTEEEMTASDSAAPAAEEPAAEGESLAAPDPEGEAGNALAAKLASLAAEGNGEAAYHLGIMHLAGMNGLAKDPQRAFELFQASAEAGDPLGAYRLGAFYDGQGEGVVEDDPALALEHKLVAAEAGYALAQHDVARFFYEQGDTDKALEYLLASAKQGYQPSLQALASLYSGEGKVAKDPVKVYAYVALLQASDKGLPSKRLEEWRDKTQAELGPEQVAEAVEIVTKWKETPSALTLKALAGEASAMRLAGLDDAALIAPADGTKPEGR